MDSSVPFLNFSRIDFDYYKILNTNRLCHLGKTAHRNMSRTFFTPMNFIVTVLYFDH